LGRGALDAQAARVFRCRRVGAYLLDSVRAYGQVSSLVGLESVGRWADGGCFWIVADVLPKQCCRGETLHLALVDLDKR
jgi:hypothetical protein